jgi:hypothetical protein
MPAGFPLLKLYLRCVAAAAVTQRPPSTLVTNQAVATTPQYTPSRTSLQRGSAERARTRTTRAAEVRLMTGPPLLLRPSLQSSLALQPNRPKLQLLPRCLGTNVQGSHAGRSSPDSAKHSLGLLYCTTRWQRLPRRNRVPVALCVGGYCIACPYSCACDARGRLRCPGAFETVRACCLGCIHDVSVLRCRTSAAQEPLEGSNRYLAARTRRGGPCGRLLVWAHHRPFAAAALAPSVDGQVTRRKAVALGAYCTTVWASHGRRARGRVHVRTPGSMRAAINGAPPVQRQALRIAITVYGNLNSCAHACLLCAGGARECWRPGGPQPWAQVQGACTTACTAMHRGTQAAGATTGSCRLQPAASACMHAGKPSMQLCCCAAACTAGMVYNHAPR